MGPNYSRQLGRVPAWQLARDHEPCFEAQQGLAPFCVTAFYQLVI